MALHDALFVFSNDQDMTGTNYGKTSTNKLNMADADLEMGTGKPVYLNVKIRDAMAGGTSFRVFLKSHTADSPNPNVGVNTICQTRQIPLSELTAGEWLWRQILPVDIDREQYVFVQYQGAGTFTAGSVDVWLDHGSQSSFNVQKTGSNI